MFILTPFVHFNTKDEESRDTSMIFSGCSVVVVVVVVVEVVDVVVVVVVVVELVDSSTFLG